MAINKIRIAIQLILLVMYESFYNDIVKRIKV